MVTGFWGGGPNIRTIVPYSFFIPRMVMFETHHAKKYAMGSGVAPQRHIPLHTTGQKRCFRIPEMVVFATHHAKKYGVGSGVAPQTSIPLHTTSQKRCFWIPGMDVFELQRQK